MKPIVKHGYGWLIIAVTTLLVGLLAVGCTDLGGTDTTSGTAAPATSPVTTAGATTSAPGGEVTTTAATAADTTSTLAPTTTIASTTTLPPAVTVTTEALSSAEELLPGGHIKALGYIKDVWIDAGKRYLKIDYVELIEGEAEATAAAIEDGLIAPGETWDAGFYINNDNPLLRTFKISDSAEIYTQFRDHLVDLDGTPCSWADFRGFWSIGPLPEGDYHLPGSPWWIERDGKTVVWIMQMFTP